MRGIREWVKDPSCLQDEVSIKIPKIRSTGSLWVGEHVEVLGEWFIWRGREAPSPFPHTLSYVFLPPTHSSVAFILSFYTKLVSKKYTLPLSSLRYFSKIKQTQGGGCGNLGFVADYSEAQITAWTFNWHLKCEESDLTFPLWDLAQSPGR